MNSKESIFPYNCACCNKIILNKQAKYDHLKQKEKQMSSTRNNPNMGSNKRVSISLSNSNNNSDNESVTRSKKAKPSVYTKEVFLQNMDMYYDLVQANQCSKDVLETQLNAIKNLYPVQIREEIRDECEEKLFVMDNRYKMLRENTFDYTQKHDDPHYQNLIHSFHAKKPKLDINGKPMVDSRGKTIYSNEYELSKEDLLRHRADGLNQADSAEYEMLRREEEHKKITLQTVHNVFSPLRKSYNNSPLLRSSYDAEE